MDNPTSPRWSDTIRRAAGYAPNHIGGLLRVGPYANRDDEVLLPRRRTGLRRDSVANASQIATINKAELEELVGTVPHDLMEAVAAGIRWFLDLG